MFNLFRNVQKFSTVAETFYIHTSNAQGYNFSTSSPAPVIFLFFSFSLKIAILVSVKWYHNVVYICISLMISDVDVLFLYLLAI